MKTFKNLEVWEKSKEVSLLIYSLSKQFPKEELFGITNQLRRASVNLTLNIVEGVGTQYKKETIPFLYIANGSFNEVEAILDLCKDLQYIDEANYRKIVTEN